jgi:hypothetical protein
MISTFSDAFEAFWEAMRQVQAAGRAITELEMLRFLPEDAAVLAVEWIDDAAENSGLQLRQIRDKRGRVLWDAAAHEDEDVPDEIDAIGTLLIFLADNWYGVDGKYPADDSVPNEDRTHFLIDLTHHRKDPS